jgi:hypothetical protein
MTSVITKIRFNILIWSLNFLIIMSVSIRRIRSVLSAICIRLFIILCYFMHLVSSHIKWWMLKSLINRCSSDLLNNYCRLYMRKSLLMFYRNFRKWSIHYECAVSCLSAWELVMRDQILNALLFKMRLESSYLLRSMLTSVLL